jgi:hypothetical protein
MNRVEFLLSNGYSRQIRQTRKLLAQLWQGESHFSQKWPLANVGESGESLKHVLANVGKSGEYSPSLLAKVGASPHDKIGCLYV